MPLTEDCTCKSVQLGIGWTDPACPIHGKTPAAVLRGHRLPTGEYDKQGDPKYESASDTQRRLYEEAMRRS